MTLIRRAEGIYQDSRTGHYHERVTIDGRRTWRKLEGRTVSIAKRALIKRRGESALAAIGEAPDPYAPPAKRVSEYLSAFIPKTQQDKSKVKSLIQHFPNIPADKIRLPRDADAYARSRERTLGRLPGRSIDLDLVLLRNVLRAAVRAGQLCAMPPGEWPRYRPKLVKHCRDAAPIDADELHKLARSLLSSHQSAVLGWQLLIQAMTGCRTSEALKLRWDAKPRQPGHIDGEWLWLARSKGGCNPFAQIHPALRQCLDAFTAWRAANPAALASPWWFPARPGTTGPVGPQSLGHALRRISQPVLGHPVTPHGLRSYFVTVRRSQGIADAQIAAEIGDRTGASIVVQTYGSVPPNWRGGPGIAWLPEGEPAWVSA